MQRIPLVSFVFLAACVIPAAPPPTTPTTSAAAPAPTPTTTLSTAGAAANVTAPSGWQSETSAQGTVLTFADGSATLKIAVLPAQPLTASLVDTFQAYWQQTLAAQMTITPLPMRARLKSGLAVAFDGGQASGDLYLDLYVVAAGDQCVPVLGVYKGLLPSSLDATIGAVLESISIPGAAPPTGGLYDPSELVGTWSTQSASIGTYVTSNGGYAGDASMAVADEIDLNADGTFTENFVGTGGGFGGTTQKNPHGAWSVTDDGVLVLDGQRRPLRGVSASALYLEAYEGEGGMDVAWSRPRNTWADWFGHP